MIATKRILYTSLIGSLWIGLSCSDILKRGNHLTEGVIEFTAEVVDKTHPMAGLAPSTATVKFKNSKLQVEMSSMGVFKTTFISDPSKKNIVQMVKFMDIENAYIETESELIEENKGYQLKLEETKETKLIAGYKCKKVIVSFLNEPTTTFEAYYTNELGTDSINMLGPYKQIKGMLMQYRLKKLGLEMSFTAKSVKKETISNDIFEIPAVYKIVNRAEMEKLFEDLQN